MTSSDDNQLLAESLISCIVNDDIDSLKLIVTTSADRESWRDVLRYEMNIEQLSEPGALLQYDIVTPKLVLWGTTAISCYHLAALRGADDVLRLCVGQIGLGVDLKLTSGMTALHCACFGGQVDTARMLIDSMKATINDTDELVFHIFPNDPHIFVYRVLGHRQLNSNGYSRVSGVKRFDNGT